MALRETEQTEAFSWLRLSHQCQFAVVSLCSIELGSLYGDASEKNREWSLGFVNSLISACGLPTAASDSAEQMYSTQSAVVRSDVQPLLTVIRQEARYKDAADNLLADLLLLDIQKGCYDARLRSLLTHLQQLLRLHKNSLKEVEAIAEQNLGDAGHQETEEERSQRLWEGRRRGVKRAVKIGLAALGGAVALGVSGGLAAPMLGVGLGALVGGGTAAVLGSASAVALVATLFGTAGAGIMGYKMNRRVGDVNEFSFTTVGEQQRSLNIVISVSGWISAPDKPELFTEPWLCLKESKETYALVWESEPLGELGDTMTGVLSKKEIAQFVASEALKETALNVFLPALGWSSTLLMLSDIVDSPWYLCLARAKAAGVLLAEALLSRTQGQRPITLVGYSLGARVIYHALKEMTKREGSAGIVENAFLLGAPVTAQGVKWLPLIEKVISGKCVVGYSQNDWVLKYLHRTAMVFGIAGLKRVDLVHDRFITFDLSDLVSGHLDYPKMLPLLLKSVGLSVDGDAYKKAEKEYHDRLMTKCTHGTGKGKDCPSCLPRISANESLAKAQRKIPSVVVRTPYCLPLLALPTHRCGETPEKVFEVVRSALLCGYRHFHCPPAHGTEAVGRAFADLPSIHGGLSREQLYITSTLSKTDAHPSRVHEACERALQVLQINYLDVYLMQVDTDIDVNADVQMRGAESVSTPPQEGGGMKDGDEGGEMLEDEPTLKDTWRAMEQLVEDGLVRSLGVSNCSLTDLSTLLEEAKIPPVLHHMVVQPYCTKEPAVEWCRRQKIHVVASSFASQTGLHDVLENDVIVQLADDVLFSPTQVCLRWSTQRGMSVLPAVTRLADLMMYVDIFNLTLFAEQMTAITSLNRSN